jgi:transcriptional regulator with XRE-family HTH domain
MNQKAIAARLGVSQAAVSEWVRGASAPGLDHLMKLPEILDVNGHWLLTGEGRMEASGDGIDLRRVRAQARAELAARLIPEITDLIQQVTGPHGIDASVSGGERSLTSRASEALEAEELVQAAKAQVRKRPGQQPPDDAAAGRQKKKTG